VYSQDKNDQNSGKGQTKDLREANENIRKGQDEEGPDTQIDPKKTGNKPRFDRDR
jgi:hypothetical protein